MDRRILLLPLLIATLVSCSEGGFQVPIASTISKPETTYTPKLPTRTRIGNYDVFDGVSEISGLVLNVDGASAKATLQGKVRIRPVSGGRAPIEVDLNVAGDIDSKSFDAYLFPTNPVQLEALGMKVGVKLMCLSEDCKESFMDIYIKYQGQIYHHQVDSTDKNSVAPKVAPSVSPTATVSPTPIVETKNPSVSPAEDDDSVAEESEGDIENQVSSDDDHEDDSDDDETPMMYVGEPEKDVEVFFPKESPGKSQIPKYEPSTDKTVKPPVKMDPTSEVKEDSVVKNIANSIVQAFGAYNKGFLKNAVNVYKYQQETQNPGFKIFNPKEKRYFATTDMLNMIAYIGKYSLEKLNGYVLPISALSRKNGGYMAPHRSHQNGMDADIGFYFDSEVYKTRGFPNLVKEPKAKSSWMAEEQWELFKNLVSTKSVDRIFIDSSLKKSLCEIARNKNEISSDENISSTTLRLMKHEKGHQDHYHLRLKCSKVQSRCRPMEPKDYKLGC